MKQLGRVVSIKAMYALNQLRYSYFTCPVCQVPIGTGYITVKQHLTTHASQLPPGTIPAIGILLANRKGCNEVLKNHPEDAVTFARDFVKKLKESS